MAGRQGAKRWQQMLIAVKMEMRRMEEPVVCRRNGVAGSLVKGEKRLARTEDGRRREGKGSEPDCLLMETSESAIGMPTTGYLSYLAGLDQT